MVKNPFCCNLFAVIRIVRLYAKFAVNKFKGAEDGQSTFIV